ncbi:discoidin domain-containing protein [Neobacillus niacini]|uniref:discoidin domain-containing protein n=1 Tax=Neobacillus niacini TaxID=86668 RepID=UPI003000DFAD
MAQETWRYVRFQGYGDNTTTGTTRLVEVQAWEGGTNRLLNKLPISGEPVSAGATIDKVTDGNVASVSGSFSIWWVGAGIPTLTWDLEALYPLTSLLCAMYSPSNDPRQTKFKLWVSKDNVAWTQIADYSNNTITQSSTTGFSFPTPVAEADTTPPGEITNLTEQHTDLAIIFDWTEPTGDADFKTVEVYRDGIHYAGDLNFETFTDTAVQPSTSYLYRFVTLDNLDNESPGVEITVTTDAAKTYEHLKPTEVTNISNFEPTDVVTALSYIDDEPDNADGLVLTPSTTLTGEPTVRVKFQLPSQPVSGLQTIKWKFYDPNYYGTYCVIYENGVEILRSSSPHYAINGVEPVVFIFDSGVITDKTLANIEVEIRAYHVGNATISNFDAIEWDVPLDYVPVSLDGVISAQSGVSAVLRKTVPVSGNISTQSSVSGNPSRSFGISGEIAVQSALSGTLVDGMVVNGNIFVESTLTGNLVKRAGLSGAISSFSSISGSLETNRGMVGNANAQSEMSGEITVNRGLIGNIGSISDVLEAPLQKAFQLNGLIEAVSAISGSLAKELFLQGNVQGVSTGNGTLNRVTLLEGSMAAVSLVELDIWSVQREMNGTIIGESSMTAYFDVEGQVQLTGAITIQSSLSANLVKDMELLGDIVAISELNLDHVDLIKPINGEIAGQSSASTWLGKSFGLDGTIAVMSSISGIMSKLISLESSIHAISTVNGEFEGETGLSGFIQAISSLDLQLDRHIGLQGEIPVFSNLVSDLIVGGQVVLDGTVFSLSSMTGEAFVNRGLFGSIQAVSELDVRAPVDTFIEVDDPGYDGVEASDDGRSLSYSITEGPGRHIQFNFEFVVNPLYLESLEFHVKGTPGQPFILRAWNWTSNRWDTSNAVTYDGVSETFVVLTLRDFMRYVNAGNMVKISMKSMNEFTSGVLTLSTDYAELRKNYFQYQ